MKAQPPAAGTGGALTVVLSWAAGLRGIDIPPEVASAVAALVIAGLSYVPGYRARDMV